MPIQNTRLAILGTPKAEKAFDLFDNDREKAQKEADKTAADLERLEAEIRRVISGARVDRAPLAPGDRRGARGLRARPGRER